MVGAPASGDAFVCKKETVDTCVGQVCVYTGSSRKPRGATETEYEMDFGVGWLVGETPADRKKMGLGYFMTLPGLVERHECQDVEEGFRLRRPDGPMDALARQFWGSPETKYRIGDTGARLNRYCGAVAWGKAERKTAKEKNYETLPHYTSALLLGYRYAYEDEEARQQQEIPMILYNALLRGRDIYPDAFASALQTSKTRQLSDRLAAADNAEEVDEEDAVPPGVLYLTSLDGLPPGDCGVFPHIATYNLCAVYGKLRHWVGHRGQEPALDYGYTLRAPDGHLETSDPGLGKQELLSALDTHWVEFGANRDWITRFARDTGFNGNEWALIGIRVHRKCYGHSLHGNAEAPDPGADPPPDPEAVPGADPEADNRPAFTLASGVVVAQSSCVPKTLVTMENWQNLQERQPDNLDAWKLVGAGDVQLVTHFTTNMRELTTHIVGQDYTHLKAVGPEYSVYWPFGLVAKSRTEIGKAYETRVDLLMEGIAKNTGGANLDPSLVLVEYKTRMELTAGAKQIYALRNANDRLQLRLNTWMIYLCTGLKVRHAYVIQASRRQEEGLLGCFGRLKMVDTPWADPFMVGLITRFALKPFGGESMTRYADQYFIVPDMVALMEAFSLSHTNIKLNDDGHHDIFDKILKGCEFSRKLRSAEGLILRGVTDVEVGFPNACFSKPSLTGMITARVAPSLCGHRPTAMRNAFNAGWRDVGRQIVVGGAADLQMFHPHHACFAGSAWDSAPGVGSYVPILFRGSKALVYCATSLNEVDDIQLVAVCPPTLDGHSLAPKPSSMMAVPGNMPIFRPAAGLVQLNRRLWKAEDLHADDPGIQAQAEACELKRRCLHGMVRKAAVDVDTRLVATGALASVPAKQFWEFSLAAIYRRHVLPATESPVVREFANFGQEPYAPPPPNMVALTTDLTEFRQGARPRRNGRPLVLPRVLSDQWQAFRILVVERCLHRLLNTRLLRASLAFVGLDDVDVTRVVVDDDADGDWSAAELAVWRRKELEAAVEQLGMDPTAQRQGVEGGDWWKSTTNRTDEATRMACFPHMSQKAMWSEETWTAIMASLSIATGNRNLVQLSADHIFEDLLGACEAFEPADAEP